MADRVSEVVVVAIPESLAYVLRVDVIGDQRACQALAADFHGTTEAGKLRRTGLRRPLPEVTQITEVEIIGDIRGDRRRQTGCPEGGLHRTRRIRLRRSCNR